VLVFCAVIAVVLVFLIRKRILQSRERANSDRLRVVAFPYQEGLSTDVQREVDGGLLPPRYDDRWGRPSQEESKNMPNPEPARQARFAHAVFSQLRR
jgi:hypothetical protein